MAPVPLKAKGSFLKSEEDGKSIFSMSVLNVLVTEIKAKKKKMAPVPLKAKWSFLKWEVNRKAIFSISLLNVFCDLNDLKRSLILLSNLRFKQGQVIRFIYKS